MSALRGASLTSALFQINMQRKMRFTGIVTQGASRIGSAEFVKAFKVASSLDGRTYTVYRTDGERRDHVSGLRAKRRARGSSRPHSPDSTVSCVPTLQVFVGNVDNDGTKTNLFDPPIVAQYLRLIPVVCRKACTLRMELVGCELNGTSHRK